jgi:hypothetical protein
VKPQTEQYIAQHGTVALDPGELYLECSTCFSAWFYAMSTGELRCAVCAKTGGGATVVISSGVGRLPEVNN